MSKDPTYAPLETAFQATMNNVYEGFRVSDEELERRRQDFFAGVAVAIKTMNEQPESMQVMLNELTDYIEHLGRRKND